MIASSYQGGCCGTDRQLTTVPVVSVCMSRMHASSVSRFDLNWAAVVWPPRFYRAWGQPSPRYPRGALYRRSHEYRTTWYRRGPGLCRSRNPTLLRYSLLRQYPQALCSPFQSGARGQDAASHTTAGGALSSSSSMHWMSPCSSLVMSHRQCRQASSRKSLLVKKMRALRALRASSPGSNTRQRWITGNVSTRRYTGTWCRRLIFPASMSVATPSRGHRFTGQGPSRAWPRAGALGTETRGHVRSRRAVALVRGCARLAASGRRDADATAGASSAHVRSLDSSRRLSAIRS